jgi:hypothetical protein
LPGGMSQWVDPPSTEATDDDTTTAEVSSGEATESEPVIPQQ